MPPDRPASPRSAATRPLAVLSLVLVAASAYLAGRPAGPAAAGEEAATASPRLTALDHEIRFVERHLTALRRARSDLAAGRPEAAPADDAAEKASDLDLRALREVQHYEAARSKAVATLADATTAKDDAKAALARGTIDGLDASFSESMKKLEDARADAKEAARPKKSAAAKGDDAPPKREKGDKPDEPAKGD